MATKPKDKDVITPKVESPAVEPKETPVKVDTAKIEEEILTSAKAKLAETLVGKGDDKWVPKDYEEIKDTTKTETLKAVDEKFEERDKKVVESAKAKKKKEATDLKKWNETWSNQVTKLTDEGHLPQVNEDIQKKLDKGDKLTGEEMKDEGLVRRSELYTKANEIKEPNLELVFHRDLKGQVDKGTTAPVLGTRKSVTPPPNNEEFAYEDITSNPSLGGPRTTTDLMESLHILTR